ncbi:hypothetical protein BST81_05070 [Leptolyngbya sp. 'hensonii']|uniref:hypothetical protein n=1 Tax=Leptolyngbya sp. 'hensonii' TaxID=1922337 RepID=UPI00094F8D53|nr:hypothetical protein [Leptolyngbya sp. 'hensonii']OLP19499.1 hypothetical protein BST81_05070 [Leptolyngbya sp. 'hensonii']
MVFKHQVKVGFPLWQYLEQPLFSADSRLILNPKRFWQAYRIQLLERCLTLDFKSEGHSRS